MDISCCIYHLARRYKHLQKGRNSLYRRFVCACHQSVRREERLSRRKIRRTGGFPLHMWPHGDKLRRRKVYTQEEVL
ncbi:hypothetical protein DPMN_127622 [Dreissena polymorpha]|uniref:Uncharacterized protein n=1 Tax=Dreissena polymorpha TaxID=45954 RepID=A0A9D4JVM1_DREPO|nr:hypothetical protein DPMN_127622 [Dreissena polymorpha]